MQAEKLVVNDMVEPVPFPFVEWDVIKPAAPAPFGGGGPFAASAVEIYAGETCGKGKPFDGLHQPGGARQGISVPGFAGQDRPRPGHESPGFGAGFLTGGRWSNIHRPHQKSSLKRRICENHGDVFPSDSSGGRVARRNPRSQWTRTHSWSRRLRSLCGLILCSSVSL